MCGITGFIDFKKTSSTATLEAMTMTLTHRGPDGSGVQLFEKDDFQLGLGHRRLSIIDLSEHGTQPMQFNDWWICIIDEKELYQRFNLSIKSCF